MPYLLCHYAWQMNSHHRRIHWREINKSTRAFFTNSQGTASCCCWRHRNQLTLDWLSCTTDVQIWQCRRSPIKPTVPWLFSAAHVYKMQISRRFCIDSKVFCMGDHPHCGTPESTQVQPNYAGKQPMLAWLWLWVKVLCLTEHKIGDFGDSVNRLHPMLSHHSSSPRNTGSY